jgi:hypothetical protein
MKKTLILIAIYSLNLSLFSQNNYNRNWMLGYDGGIAITGNLIDFGTEPPTQLTKIIDFSLLFSNSQISNAAGEFQFYTNGCDVYDTTNQVMENGENINPGLQNDYLCSVFQGSDYYQLQSLITLPWPDKENEYAIFHLGWELPPGESRQLFYSYYTKVDMSANAGLGAVIEKNKLLLQDTFLDNVTAVRHGNGRDWWILQPKSQSNVFFTYLLQPNSIQGPFKQTIGRPFFNQNFTTGQATFSPDGSKYIFSSKNDSVNIYDFDRCSGKLSRPLRFPLPGPKEEHVSGAAVSPNNRFLYLSTGIKLWQYDLYSKDIENSKIFLDEVDDFVKPFPATFYQMHTAINGRIYMGSTNGAKYLHVINQPDSFGLACDFQQHGFPLITYHGATLPNYPNFRVYDVQGSPCDTLGINAPSPEFQVIWRPADRIRLFPNPAQDMVQVTFPPSAGGLLKVFTAAGAFLRDYTVDNDRYFNLDCTSYPDGAYMVVFYPKDNQNPMTARLVVQR